MSGGECRGGTIFQRFAKEGFSFFVTKRLKYDVEGGERGYIFHLSLDIKGRKDFFFFLRETFEVIEKKISRYFITSYYTFSFSTKYQNVMKRRIKAYRVETYVSFERNLKELH